MEEIERHELDVEHYKDIIEHDKRMLQRARDNPIEDLSRLDLIQDKCGSLVAQETVFAPEWSEQVRLCKVRARALAAMLDLADSTEGEVQVELPGFEPATLERVGPHNLVDNGEWESAFWAAVICRDGESLQTVCDTSTQTLRDAPGTTIEPYALTWVDALRAFQLGEPEAPELLVRAMELADPDALELGNTEYALDIAVPKMDVLFRLLDNDAEAFNDALYKALERHKAYYGKKKDYRYRTIKGLLSLPLTGLCAYAVERGVPVAVESGYIPPELYSGEYL